eukprot:scaffold6691_cov358-Prasinococcus_capsulatus_cf.AAC.14
MIWAPQLLWRPRPVVKAPSLPRRATAQRAAAAPRPRHPAGAEPSPAAYPAAAAAAKNPTRRASRLVPAPPRPAHLLLRRCYCCGARMDGWTD